MDEDVLASMTETLLRDRPNTYCLTKAISEEFLFQNAKDLPLGIFRPSIIGASWQEPAPVSFLLLVATIFHSINNHGNKVQN